MFEGSGPQSGGGQTHVEAGGRDGWRRESVDLEGADLRTKAMVSVVRRLASPAVDQAAFLERLEVGVDELALQFDDLATPLPQGLTAACRGDLAELDHLLAEIAGPGGSHLLTLDALASAAEWSRVRALADKFLADLATVPSVVRW